MRGAREFLFYVAIGAGMALGTSSVAPLALALRSATDVKVRRAAAEALGRLRDDRAVTLDLTLTNNKILNLGAANSCTAGRSICASALGVSNAC